MLIKCKVDSSYSQISFSSTQSTDDINPWDAEGALDNRVGYNKDGIAVGCEDWNQTPVVIVSIQDFAPDGSYEYKGSYLISSSTKQFQLGHPDTAGEGITFEVERDTIEVKVFTDGKEKPRDICLVIEDTEIYVIIPYDPNFSWEE